MTYHDDMRNWSILSGVAAFIGLGVAVAAFFVMSADARFEVVLNTPVKSIVAVAPIEEDVVEVQPWGEYHNSQYDFNVTFPDTWSVDEGHESGLPRIAVSLDELNYIKYFPVGGGDAKGRPYDFSISRAKLAADDLALKHWEPRQGTSFTGITYDYKNHMAAFIPVEPETYTTWPKTAHLEAYYTDDYRDEVYAIIEQMTFTATDTTVLYSVGRTNRFSGEVSVTEG